MKRGLITGIDSGFIHNMLYCEYKAILYMESPSKPRGRLEARKLLEDLAKSSGGRLEVKVIEGVVNGVLFRLSPGAIYYEEGRVRGLVRGVIRTPPRVHDHDFATLNVAALILQESMNTGEDLILAVAAGDSIKSLRRAVENVLSKGPKPARGDGWFIATRVYNPAQARILAGRAAAIASNPGLAKPRPSPGRCGACDYRSKCRFKA